MSSMECNGCGHDESWHTAAIVRTGMLFTSHCDAILEMATDEVVSCGCTSFDDGSQPDPAAVAAVFDDVFG